MQRSTRTPSSAFILRIGAKASPCTVGVEYYDAAGYATDPAPDGRMVVDLANYVYLQGGGIEQTVATVAGQSYDVSFWAGNSAYAGRDGTGIVRISIDGTWLQDIATAQGTSQISTWAQRSFSFTASGQFEHGALLERPEPIPAFRAHRRRVDRRRPYHRSAGAAEPGTAAGGHRRTRCPPTPPRLTRIRARQFQTPSTAPKTSSPNRPASAWDSGLRRRRRRVAPFGRRFGRLATHTCRLRPDPRVDSARGSRRGSVRPCACRCAPRCRLAPASARPCGPAPSGALRAGRSSCGCVPTTRRRSTRCHVRSPVPRPAARSADQVRGRSPPYAQAIPPCRARLPRIDCGASTTGVGGQPPLPCRLPRELRRAKNLTVGRPYMAPVPKQTVRR